METQQFTFGEGRSQILVEVSPTQVTEEASERGSREWPAERNAVASLVRKASDSAIDAAFDAIRAVAQRTTSLVAELQNGSGQPVPTNLEIEFGVKFGTDLQVYVAKASTEGTISVKLSWSIKPKE